MKLVKLVGTGALVATAAAVTLFGGDLGSSVMETPSAHAADHLDPPNRVSAGDSADIGDLYAFKRTVGVNDKLVVILTFAGPLAPVAGQGASLDANVLYEIHIGRDGNTTPDVSMDVRFAANDLGNWGVRATNVPGSNGPIVGNIETELTDNLVKVYAGLREDPFFFDLQGFEDTVSTGNLAFDSARDSFAGQNITALVIEMPMSAALMNASTLDIWATTGTLPTN